MAITGTINKSTLTLKTGSKDSEKINLTYDENIDTTTADNAAEGKFGGDITTIVASSVAKAPIELDPSVSDSKVTSIAGGKADDIFTTSKDITISGGAGKDQFISNGGTLTVADYTVGQDTIRVGNAQSLDDIDFEVKGKNVTFTYKDSEGNNKASVEVLNSKSGNTYKLITIIDEEGKVIGQQSFQASKETEEDYTADDKNTGTVLRTKAAYVDASGRSKELTYQLTGEGQAIDGGKGKDIFEVQPGTAADEDGDGDAVSAVYRYATITGGKGDDVFVVNNYTKTTITDYTKGGKELIKLGEGMQYAGYYVPEDTANVVLKFNESGSSEGDPATATVTIINGVWDQLTTEKSNYIKIVDDGNNSIEGGLRGFEVPGVRYVTSLDKTTPNNLNSYDLGKIDEIKTKDKTFELNPDKYDAVIFTPKVNVSLQAGGGYQTIAGGAGNDTIIGENRAIETEGTESTDESGANKEGLFSKNSISSFESDIKGDSITYTYSARLQGENIQIVVVLSRDSDDGAFKVSSVNGSGSGEVTLAEGFTYFPTNSLWDFKVDKIILGNGGDVDDIGESIKSALTENESGDDGIAYSYTYDANKTQIYGGAGNDILIAQLSGGKFYGGAGNDTLRGGKGNTQLTGDAGSDVFVLDGRAGRDNRLLIEDEDGNVTYEVAEGHYDESTTIKDYSNSEKDKLIVSWDKYAANNNAYATRASIISGSFDAEKKKLKLEVGGQSWIAPSEGNAGVEEDAPGVGFNDTYTSGTYYVNVEEGDVISITEKGITYNQKMGAANDDGEVTVVDENYLGIIDPNAEKISASTSKKGVQIVAGIYTTEIIGGEKADTLIGNGGVAGEPDEDSEEVTYEKDNLTGGKGNDIFVVKSGEEITNSTMGDVIADYNAAGMGSDKIQVTNLKALGQLKDSKVILDTEENTVKATYTPGNDGSRIYTVVVGVDEFAITLDENNKVLSVDTTGSEHNYIMTAIKEGDVIGELEELTDGTPNARGVFENRFKEGTSIYKVSANDERIFGNSVDKDVFIGGIEIREAENKAITFQQVDEVVAENGLSSKTVTQVMTRTFGTADKITADKNSTYLEIFDGIDSNVKVVDASKAGKGLEIVNNGNAVESILGGGKVDTIYVGANDGGEEISVTSGKGNDIIVWDGSNDVYITDFAASTFKTNKWTFGDNVLFSGDVARSYAEGTGENGGKVELTWDANDVVYKYVATNKDGAETHTLTLKGMKDKNILIASSEELIGKEGAIVDGTNPHEIILTGNTLFNEEVSKVVKGDGEGKETWIINAASSGKPQEINLRKNGESDFDNNISTVYGGKAADTIYASSALARADLGAGNDVIYTGGASSELKVTTDAGNDVIVLEENTTGKVIVNDYTVTSDKLSFDSNDIAGVTSTFSTSIVTKVKGKDVTTNYYNYSVELTSGGTVELNNVVEGSKITRVDGSFTIAKPTYYSLDYVTGGKIVLGAKDYYNGAVVDLKGIAATEVEVEKTAKGAAVKGLAADSKVSVALDKKNNTVVFYGNTYSSATAGATYVGGNGGDIYYGSGAVDAVNLGDGNDTIAQAEGKVVKAEVTSGAGNDIFVAGKGDEYTITDYEVGKDKIVFTDAESKLTKTSYNSENSTLTLEFTADAAKKDSEGNSSSGTGKIYITNYKTDTDITFGQLGTDKKGNTIIANANVLTQRFGDSTLKLTNAATNVVVDKDINPVVNKVDASERSGKNAKAISIDASGNSNVKEIIGGDGADILAIGANGSLTGGKGNDTFVLTPNTFTSVTITDYEKGTNKVEVKNAENETYFTGLVDYDKRVSFGEDNSIVITDNGKTIKLNNAQPKKVQVGTTGITFSDPVNVKLAKGAETDWTKEDSKFDASRVETFDASATTTEVKFVSGTNFSKFVANKQATTLTINNDNTQNVEITLGDDKNAVATITLGTAETKDTITYKKGTLTVTNFDASKDFEDEIKGINLTKVKDQTFSDSVLTFKVEGKEIKMQGTGVKSETADNGDKYVHINGIGDIVYEKAPATADFEERFEELVGDFVATDDLSDITAVKAAVTTDNNFSTNNTVEFKLAASSALTNNKKQA